MTIRRVPEITAEQERFRVEPVPGLRAVTPRRDPVESVPAGTYIAQVFRVTGYDPDCDGSLMARMAAVDAEGEESGWEPTHLGLYPDSAWILDSPDELDRTAARLAEIRALAESLGDRSDEPALPAPPAKVHLPLSDRRIIEPVRRMLLEILNRP